MSTSERGVFKRAGKLQQAAFVIFTTSELLSGCNFKPSAPLSPEKPLIASPVPSAGEALDLRYYENETAWRQKQELERKYGIRILTKGQVWEEKIGGRLVPGHPDLIPKWTTASLNLLDKELEVLPAHFYQKKSDGRQIQVVLGSEDTASCYPNGFAMKDDPCTVELTQTEHTTSLRQHSLTRLAHELTHIATPTTIVDDTIPIYQQEKMSPWFSKAESIIGGKLPDVRSNYYQKINENRALLSDQTLALPRVLLDQLITPEQHEEYFYRRLEYGLGYYNGRMVKTIRTNEDAMEFLGVISEFYLYGKQFFVSVHSKVFALATAEQLYEFLKNDVYRGKEYSAFPLNN